MNFSEHKVRLEGVAGYYLALSFSIPHPVLHSYPTTTLFSEPINSMAQKTVVK